MVLLHLLRQDLHLQERLYLDLYQAMSKQAPEGCQTLGIRLAQPADSWGDRQARRAYRREEGQSIHLRFQ